MRNVRNKFELFLITKCTTSNLSIACTDKYLLFYIKKKLNNSLDQSGCDHFMPILF